MTLQRRASFQTHKGRCSTLNYCMFLSLNGLRFKNTCSSVKKPPVDKPRIWEQSAFHARLAGMLHPRRTNPR
ncbi:hypothetical protein CO664_00870 [Sinorhizobium sp. NG07B]|nr:hypothetical protein CO664_00870 [Sinorhizobium sp. NG07B]